MVILTVIEFSQNANLFEQSKKSVGEIIDEKAGGCGEILESNQAIKSESASLAENQEALF